MTGDAPLGVVVLDHQRVGPNVVGAGPPAALKLVGHRPKATAPASNRTTCGYASGDMALHCYLGHGASGTSASMSPFVDGLRSRGIEATAIDLPKRKAEEAIPAFHKVVPRDADVVVGGHSFGGRVASLAAAEPGAPYAALLLF